MMSSPLAEPLSAYYADGVYHVVFKKKTTLGIQLYEIISTDGINFEKEKKISLGLKIQRYISNKDIDECSFFVSKDTTHVVLSHTKGKKRYTIIGKAIKKDSFLYEGTIQDIAGTSAFIDRGSGGKTLILGDMFVRAVEVSEEKYTLSRQLLFTTRYGYFDNVPLRIIGSYVRHEDTVLFYDASIKKEDGVLLQTGAVILDKQNPYHVIWRSDISLYEQFLPGKSKVRSLGVITTGDDLYLYWSVDGEIITIPISNPFVEKKGKKGGGIELVRYEHNPLLSPRSEFEWESEAVFNPAVMYDGDEVHILYRAIGSDGISRVGYASSEDGFHFTDGRLSHPVFDLSTESLVTRSKTQIDPPQFYCPSYYTSGGSWGGCEDPRTVKIGGRVYMTYVAFGGWDSIRIALTSISEKDIKSKIWNWKKPIYISPIGQRNKNWVLFPEKINGKYAILHSITPKITVDYVDDIDKPFIIQSNRPEGPQPGRRNYWDNKIRGAGAPPIKTKLGWLLLYHATDMYDPNKYKIGAMVLDLDDPTRVLFRSTQPLLVPDAHYENDGKPGVVYASGAIIKDDKLFVYYGGGDKHLCVATIDIDVLLSYLKNNQEIKLESQSVNM